jgi:hypothetical protein
MDLTREEQETIIRSSAADQEWDICTADPRIIRKLEKRGYQKEDRRNPTPYVSFRIPFKRLSFLSAAERPQRTEAQMEAARKLANHRRSHVPLRDKRN